ncbi:hypothetical protein [Oryzomonas rubra]|uniref:Phage tail tube protein n=1 Tax=Oryzomonas rubra TaxID=2509454 RepID=A0A5A9X6P2_9BACT|nr:hypothetical protein [Oryzomonas rubra]KAA0888767.1 hypothetical protein ET418_15415 [Oryzomonas rubra]
MALDTATGNRVLLKIKGIVIGMCQNVSFDDDFGLQEVDGIGDLEVAGFEAGKLTHRISGEKYFVKSQTLVKLGFIPNSTGWLTAPELAVEVVDSVSGETVESYSGCKFNTHSRKYNKHSITGESFQIFARHKETA